MYQFLKPLASITEAFLLLEHRGNIAMIWPMMEQKNFWIQNKNKGQILLLIIGAILLLFGLNWFWSLGAVASVERKFIRVEAVEGHVEWKRANESEWRELTATTEVSTGDSVRTDASARAQILWGDRGVTRLDPATEIVLDEAPKGNTINTAFLRVRLESGRVWSRMLKMIDINEGMQVQTNNVVATIRGTSFGVAKEEDGSKIAITDSVVDAALTLVREGQWGTFDKDGKLVEVRQLTDADAWAGENRTLDRAFDDAKLHELETRFQQRISGGAQAPIWILQLSEQLHLSFLAGDKKEARRETYALRHLALSSESNSFDAQLKAAENLFAGKSVSGEFQNELHAWIALSLSARDAGQNIKLSSDQLVSLEGLRLRLANSEEGAFTIKAVELDEKIDQLLYGTPPEGVTAGTLLASIADFVDQVKRSSSLQPKSVEQLVRRAEAMGYRLGFEGFGKDISSDTPEKPFEEGAPATDIQNQDENAAQATSSTSRIYRQLSLFASPSRVSVGDEVRLTLYGITVAGTTAVLNENATFGIVPPGEGKIVSNTTFIPSVPGQIKISATYEDPEGMRTVFATVQVEKPVAVSGYSGLTFVFQTDLTAPCGAKLPFKIKALYKNGTQKDVTLQASKSVSDPNLIYVQSDSVVTYCPAQQSSAEVYATYMEDGIRQTTQATITVVPDPAPGGGANAPGAAAGMPLLLY